MRRREPVVSMPVDAMRFPAFEVNVDAHNGYPAVAADFPAQESRRLALAVKRALDIVGALAGLVICGIAYLIFARSIRRETGASVLFRQRRVGMRGRQFTMYKLRTMTADAELRLRELADRNEMKGHIFKIKNDPRVTPLGKFLRRYHVDELPQFLNVLRGEMSLVGSRPPTPNEVAAYKPHHHRRLDMKPGLTGAWQVMGNGAVPDFEDVVKLDRWYIDNWSLMLDAKILLKTISVLARGTGW